MCVVRIRCPECDTFLDSEISDMASGMNGTTDELSAYFECPHCAGEATGYWIFKAEYTDFYAPDITEVRNELEKNWEETVLPYLRSDDIPALDYAWSVFIDNLVKNNMLSEYIAGKLVRP